MFFFIIYICLLSFGFLIVAAEMSCAVWCLLHIEVSCEHPSVRDAQSTSLCSHLHAGTAVRGVAAHLSGRMSLTLSTLQLKPF